MKSLKIPDKNEQIFAEIKVAEKPKYCAYW